jgi:hypothetical protein
MRPIIINIQWVLAHGRWDRGRRNVAGWIFRVFEPSTHAIHRNSTANHSWLDFRPAEGWAFPVAGKELRSKPRQLVHLRILRTMFMPRVSWII